MKVVAVSYLNTVPFIYGIEHAAPEWLRAALTLAIPSACADSLINRQADIALVPVAEIPKIKCARIITDFCISADGYVDTVALLSNDTLENITTIYLDTHSRTSVMLARVLAHELWHISPNWVNGIPENELKPGEAVVAIGDKVFEIQSRFSQKWDLAQQWKVLTGLPFVFAAWVARTDEGFRAEDELNRALEYGCNHIGESIPPRFDYHRSYEYLTHNIQFRLDDPKRESMRLFWEKIITPG